MAWFLVRVELHKEDNYNVSAEDYEKLHAEMAKEQFKRTVTSDEKVEYQLPTAEYFTATDDTVEIVLEAAKKAATKVVNSSYRVKGYSAIVAKTDQLRWQNLPKVQKPVEAAK